MLDLCAYLSHQVQEAWGGQETGRGMSALPSPGTGLDSDWFPCQPRSQEMRMEQNCRVCPFLCKAPVLCYCRREKTSLLKPCSPNVKKNTDRCTSVIHYLSSSWLLWGGVGREAGTSTVLGPWAMARASRSSSVLNGTCSGFGTRPLDTVWNRSILSIWKKTLCLFAEMKVLPGYVFWKETLKIHPPECLPMAAALLASSSVVANPLIIFCRFTGGGVGGRDAGGVGGLLRLLCFRNQDQCNVRSSCCRPT